MRNHRSIEGRDTMGDDGRIERFLAADRYAVAGASQNRQKYGNKVLRALRASGRSTYALHPAADQVEGEAAYASLAELPEAVESLSIVTPPQATELIVQQAIAAGVKRIWMQPGAEHAEAIEAAQQAGIEVIAGGPCVLVVLARGA